MGYSNIMKYMSNFVNLDELVDKIDAFVEKAELWQLLFDECPLAIAVFDHSFRFYVINTQFTKSTGFTSEEIIGKDIKNVIPNRFRKLHKTKEKEYAKYPEKKVNRHGLSPYILNKNGQEIPINIDISYIEYDAKIYYIAFFQCLST